MIKPLRFTEDNCKKILKAIKNHAQGYYSRHRIPEPIYKFEDGRTLSLTKPMDGEITYSAYLTTFALTQKRWITQAEMGVNSEVYEEISLRANALLDHFHLDNVKRLSPFDGISKPGYSLKIGAGHCGITEAEIMRLSNAVYGHSHEDMQERIGEDISELKSQVPQQLVPLDSAIELVELREKEIMELRLEIEGNEEKIETMAKEKEEEIASTKEETADDIWRTLLEDTHQYLKQEDDKSLTRTIRDYLHHVVRDKKFQDAINKIGVATDDKWERLIAALEKPKINIERVNDIHGNDHVEAGL